MSIIFHKNRHWLQTPQITAHGLLMDSKRRSISMPEEKHLARKIRSCYPRGKTYNNLERIEYFSKRGY